MEVSVQGRGESGQRAGRFDVLEQLNAIARPRLTGSEGAARVTAHVRAALTGLGYHVRDHDFRFNPWPGRLGLSAVGVLYTAAALRSASLLYGADAAGALATLIVVLLAAGLVVAFARPLLDTLSWALQDGKNLVALPAAGRPKYLVVAHRDSKSQPVPLFLRGPAIALALLSWLALLVLAALSLAQPVPSVLVLVAGGVAVLAGLLLTLCWVENDSPGALDNASGVAALLGIAHAQRAAADVAFLVTDAEELGLAGARAIAARLPNVIGAINLDGIDDAGPFHLVERFGLRRKRGLAPHLAAALLRAADELKLDARRRDVPFGIMLDHIPLVEGGTPALTIMRGGLESLRRVHRPGDDLARLRGDGIAPAIALVGRALDILRAQEPGAAGE